MFKACLLSWVFTSCSIISIAWSQPYTQYCKNCDIGPECVASEISVNNHTGAVSVCNNSCTANPDCVMAVYEPRKRTCYLHNCTQVDLSFGTNAVRQSLNSECLEYEIFILTNHSGLLENEIPGSSAYNVSLYACIERCLDMPSCRGTSYDEILYRCEFHNETVSSARPGYTFMKKRCIEDSTACYRNYTATCLDCSFGPDCQWPLSYHVNVTSLEDCEALLLTMPEANTAFYNDALCNISVCSQIKQSRPGKTIRRTCSSDCSEYNIFIMHGYNGTCQIIGNDDGGVTLEYCLEKCLDLDGCRGVSYNQADLRCDYHDCDETIHSGSFSFVKRVCVNATEKTYVQACLNCGITCSHPTFTQSGIHIAAHCNTTCDNCESILYDAAQDTCHQFQCDYATLPSTGATLFRKTSNPDCLTYEIFALVNQDANCEVIGYDIGGMDPWLCQMQCMDKPGCRAAKFDIPTDMCTYHSCSNHTSTTNPGGIINFFIEKVCIDDCASPATHVCFNCEAGPDCQSPFLENQAPDTLCESYCMLDDCEGARYDNGTCSVYQCNEVDQKYGSKYYRKTCNVNDDCPLYEVYKLTAHYGFGNTLWVEYLVTLPMLCMKRCLDTPGCRAVTYDHLAWTCTYHGGDCSVAFIPRYTFMWRYCINDASSITILPVTTGNATTPAPVNMFPKADINCFGTTGSASVATNFTTTTPTVNGTTGSASVATTSATTTPPVNGTTGSASVATNSTTTTPPVNGTTGSASVATTSATTTPPVNGTAPVPSNSVTNTTPCFCSCRLFSKLSSEEFISRIIAELTINMENTSAARRKQKSAEDNRTIAKAVGGFGVALLIFGVCIVVSSDLLNFFKSLKQVKNRIQDIRTRNKN